MAVHDAYAYGETPLKPEHLIPPEGSGDPSEDVIIRLVEGHRLFGTVRSDHGNPLSGVRITVFQPFHLPALSDDRGNYRTLPHRPGKILVNASWHPENPPPPEPFTEESRHVTLEDRDLRVDFGPTDRHVTWKGRLMAGGEAAPEGTRLHYSLNQARDGSKHRINDKVRTGEDGAFRVVKLLPGRYSLVVNFPDQDYISAGEIVFENPGPVERDVILDVAGLEGVLVDAETGLPFERGPCTVQVEMPGGSSGVRTVRNIRDGRFRLAGLRPGTYRLSVMGPQVDRTRIESVEVLPGRITRDFRVPVHRGGQLTIEREGLGYEKSLQALLKTPTGHFRDIVAITPHQPARTVCLSPGPWLIELFMNGNMSESILKRVDIEVGREQRLVIRKEDFAPFTGSVALTGWIAYDDGRPAAGGRVRFHPMNIPGSDVQALENRVR